MVFIETIHGRIEESRLTKREGTVDTDREYTLWTEYWLGEELVHRSVHVRLKESPGMQADAEGL